MDAVENQRQVSHRAHSPWKSLTTRFPHFHSRDEERKSGKRKARLPLFPLTVLCLFLRLRKEAWLRIASLPLQAHSSMRKCYPLPSAGDITCVAQNCITP